MRPIARTVFAFLVMAACAYGPVEAKNGRKSLDRPRTGSTVSTGSVSSRSRQPPTRRFSTASRRSNRKANAARPRALTDFLQARTSKVGGTTPSTRPRRASAPARLGRSRHSSDGKPRTVTRESLAALSTIRSTQRIGISGSGLQNLRSSRASQSGFPVRHRQTISLALNRVRAERSERDRRVPPMRAGHEPRETTGQKMP